MHQADAIRCFLILTDAEVGLLWLGLIRRSNNWKHLAWFPKESSLARQRRLWQGPDIDNNKKKPAGRLAHRLTGAAAAERQWRHRGGGGGAAVVTGIFCGDLQFFAACFHARNRGLCLITMTGTVALLGNRTEGRAVTVERYSPKLLLSSIIIAISLHHLSGRRHLISRCTVLGMSKKYHNEL